MATTFKAGTASASAPEFEDGDYLGKFLGVKAETLAKSQFDPNVFIWAFELQDEDGKTIYKEDGDPLEVEKLTSQSTNVKSKTTPGAVKVLKALMTAKEFSAFEEGESEVSEDELLGRIVRLELEHKENGWPNIVEVRRKAGAK